MVKKGVSKSVKKLISSLSYQETKALFDEILASHPSISNQVKFETIDITDEGPTLIPKLEPGLVKTEAVVSVKPETGVKNEPSHSVKTETQYQSSTAEAYFAVQTARRNLAQACYDDVPSSVLLTAASAKNKREAITYHVGTCIALQHSSGQTVRVSKEKFRDRLVPCGACGDTDGYEELEEQVLAWMEVFKDRCAKQLELFMWTGNKKKFKQGKPVVYHYMMACQVNEGSNIIVIRDNSRE